MKLHDDFEWIVNHSWSLRFTFLAFLLSASETILPLITNLQGIPGYSYLLIAVTVLAMVSRVVAQVRPDTSKAGDGDQH